MGTIQRQQAFHDRLAGQRARDITVDAIDDFKSGKLDEIYIVYTKICLLYTSTPPWTLIPWA